jgi:hypothetical protein
MNTPVFWILVVVFGGVVAFGGHRLLLWMELKGWIFYRNSGNPSGALGNAFMALHSVFDSESGRAAEHRLHEEKEESESGEPPISGV